MTCIFISHSHLDEEIADLLIDFLSESIEISKKEIRCTLGSLIEEIIKEINKVESSEDKLLSD